MWTYGKSYTFGLLICYRRDLRQLVDVKKSDRKCLRALELTTFIKIQYFITFFLEFWTLWILFLGCPIFVECHFGQKVVNSNTLRHFQASKNKNKKNFWKFFSKKFKKKKFFFSKSFKFGKSYIFELLICYRRDLRQFVVV